MGDWLYPLLRFAHYALLLGLFGFTAFRNTGLRQTMARHTYGKCNAALTITAAASPILTVALMLVSIAAMMAQPVWQLEWTVIEAMVTSTGIGWAFLARLGLLIAASATLIFFPRSAHTISVAALLFGLALTTLAWSGHAAATEGLRGMFHRLNDSAHLLAAGLWIGAIGWFAYLTKVAHNRPDMIMPSSLLADMHSFAPLGIFLVSVVSITGLANAYLIIGLADLSAVLETDYGWLLVTKLGLVICMLLFAARNSILGRRHANIPSLHSDTTESTLKHLRLSLAAEVTLAVAIIGLTALLGTLSPVDQ